MKQGLSPSEMREGQLQWGAASLSNFITMICPMGIVLIGQMFLGSPELKEIGRLPKPYLICLLDQ